MTTVAYKPKTSALLNRPYSGRTWHWAVCPTPLLADLIQQHIPELHKASPTAFLAQKEDGWRDYLSTRIASIRRTKIEAASRRLHDIEHCKSKVTRIDFADATCLALGLDIDRDTDIPTLPGSFPLAKALILERAAFQGVSLTDEEADHHALTTQRLSLLIIAYPHNADRLVKLAPFDCLRPI